jgi:O-Antigen ligase
LLHSPPVSSIATVPRRGASGPVRAAPAARVWHTRAQANPLLGLGLAGALTLYAFLTGGGVDLGPNTWAEIALVLIGVALAVVVLVRGAPGPAWGGATLALLAALTAFTALSIAWSVQPDNSWTEANRAVSYLAAFGGAVALARLFPQRWPALIGAIATLATALGAWALIVKVFPGTLDPADPLGRVKAPFDYWNAVGLIGALGLPACLWAGSRREGNRALRALCAPAIVVLVTALLLSYSRSALLAAIVGTGLWFALGPNRLRGVVPFATGLVGAAVLTGWALSTHPLTHDGASLGSRTAAGHSFGILLALVLVMTTAGGFIAAFVIDRVVAPPQTRRRIGTLLICAVAVLPLGGVVVLATSSRGLTGEVSHLWGSLTNATQITGDVPGRLVQLGNSRPRYWGEALRVGEHNLLAGVGALGYTTARTRYTLDRWLVGHAHSYVLETFADFGLIGVLLNLALLVAWSVASARTLGANVGRAAITARGSDLERAGMVTLLCMVIVFGISSAVDWTWFIPGTAVPALLCAGWLAGRGPLAQRVGVRGRRLQLSTRPGLAAALGGLLAVVLLTCWMMLAPLRSSDADSAAVLALTQGHAHAALADARTAAARDPVSIEPLFELSAIYSSLGDQSAAHAELIAATNLQPANPETWQQLGLYELQQHQLQQALAALQRALTLNRRSEPTIQAIAQARSQLGAPAGSG